MKKIDPTKELDKIQTQNRLDDNRSSFKNLMVPALVVVSSCALMMGASFSTDLLPEAGTNEIKIDIINGDDEIFTKTVNNGPFSQVINSSRAFGSLECSSGYLEYDPVTGTVYNDMLTEDTNCVLSFVDGKTSAINYKELKKVNDNYGTSYYFKGDSDNNYVKLGTQLFRIVRINGDGSYRLILNSVNSPTFYGDLEYDYSPIKEHLEMWAEII